jgi:hypothetical protein
MDVTCPELPQPNWQLTSDWCAVGTCCQCFDLQSPDSANLPPSSAASAQLSRTVAHQLRGTACLPPTPMYKNERRRILEPQVKATTYLNAAYLLHKVTQP